MEIHTVSCRVVQHRWEAPCSIAAALLEAPGKKATKIRKHINGLQTPIDLTSSVITARARARSRVNTCAATQRLRVRRNTCAVVLMAWWTALAVKCLEPWRLRVWGQAGTWYRTPDTREIFRRLSHPGAPWLWGVILKKCPTERRASVKGVMNHPGIGPTSLFVYSPKVDITSILGVKVCPPIVLYTIHL